MVEVYILIDCSWSADNLKSDVISHIHTIHKLGMTFEIYTFNSTIEMIARNQRIDDYDIGGRTCFYDSLGELLQLIEERKPFYPPDIVIWTDGIDTGSGIYTFDTIERMVQLYSDRGWRFTFPYIKPFTLKLKSKKNRCC